MADGPDDPEASTAVGHALWDLTSRLGQRLDSALTREAGISLAWFILLRRLASTAPGDLRMRDAGAALVMTSGGMTRMVDRIEAAGHVERRACPRDRRALRLYITDAGRAVLRQAELVYRRELETHLLRHLHGDEVRQLRQILAKLGHGA